MRSIQITVIGLAAAAALAAQEPADVFFSAPLQVRADGASTFKFISGGMLGGAVVKNAPYSAQAVTGSTQTLADGNRIVNQSTSSLARDSEGRERREQSIGSLGPLAPQGDPVQIVFISDPVAGVNYSLNSTEKTAIKLPIPDLSGALPGLPALTPGAHTKVVIRGGDTGFAAGGVTVGGAALGEPMVDSAGGAVTGPRVMYFRKQTLETTENGQSPVSQSAVSFSGKAAAASSITPNVEQLGTKTIEGVQATGTRTTFTIPAGQIGNDKPIDVTDERWYSNELQVVMLSTHSDPRMGTTSYALKNVSRGEPSPTLFQVPSDYTMTDAPEPFTQKLR